MDFLIALAVLALDIYWWVLIIRLIADLVMSFSRGWRPSGILVPLLEIVYTLTDPPLRFIRRFIPPLQLGGISLDFAFIVVLIGINILQAILSGFLI
jgi:YggT family protein